MLLEAGGTVPPPKARGEETPSPPPASGGSGFPWLYGCVTSVSASVSTSPSLLLSVCLLQGHVIRFRSHPDSPE